MTRSAVLATGRQRPDQHQYHSSHYFQRSHKIEALCPQGRGVQISPLTQPVPTDVLHEDLAWATFAGVVAVYIVSRGIGKAGSKEGCSASDAVTRSSRQTNRPLADKRVSLCPSTYAGCSRAASVSPSTGRRNGN